MSAALIKELRERTGLGLLECKKALSESDGDVDQAIENLRKSSGIKAAKKAGRVAADGIVATKISDDEAFGYDEIFQGLREFDLDKAIDEEFKDWQRKSKYLNFTKEKAKEERKKKIQAEIQAEKEWDNLETEENADEKDNDGDGGIDGE